MKTALDSLREAYRCAKEAEGHLKKANVKTQSFFGRSTTVRPLQEAQTQMQYLVTELYGVDLEA